MKKCLIFLMFACLLAVSCANKGHYEGYYITYDEVAVRESPAADAPVVLKLICKNRPRSYKQAKGDVPCAFVADSDGPSPIGIKKVDESGKWGYIEERIPLIINWKGWVLLDEMLPCGTRAADEIVPTYEVREDGLDMYKHPEENSKDRVPTTKLKEGEKVLLRASKGRWSFVSRLLYANDGKESEKFGWVRTKSLAQVDAVSRRELKEEMFGNMMEKSKHARIGINTTTILRKIFLVGSILGLLFTLAFLAPSIRRKLWIPVLLWMPGCTLLLFMGSYLTSAPALVYALLMVPLGYVLTHPLRFRGNPNDYFVPLWIISVGGSVIALIFLIFFSGRHLILNIFVFAFDVFVIALLTSFVTARIEHDFKIYKTPKMKANTDVEETK